MDKEQPTQKDRPEHKVIDPGGVRPERIERRERTMSRGVLSRIHISATMSNTTNTKASRVR